MLWKTRVAAREIGSPELAAADTKDYVIDNVHSARCIPCRFKIGSERKLKVA